jgi:guanylate kinase
MRGRIYVFSGPSGVGKSTIIRELRKRVKDLGYSVSQTSRRPRSMEADGVDYHFVDKGTFSRMIEEDAFVEWAKVYADLYGTSYSSLDNQISQGLDVLLDIDSQGAKNIKGRFEDSTLIYILPPSLEILEKRLRDRAADSDETIDVRIKKALDEIRDCAWYDYIIINEVLDKAVGDAESIIVSDRCRNSRAFPKVKEVFGI